MKTVRIAYAKSAILKNFEFHALFERVNSWKIVYKEILKMEEKLKFSLKKATIILEILENFKSYEIAVMCWHQFSLLLSATYIRIFKLTDSLFT